MSTPSTLDKVVDGLSKNVMLVSVTIHMWRGQYKISQAAVAVGQTALADELRTDPRWNLMPDHWRTKFADIESKIRTILARARPCGTTETSADLAKMGIPEVDSTVLRGVSIIPRSKAPAVFAEIKKLDDEVFKPLVNSFCNQWQEIVDGLCERIPAAVWQEAAKHLPTTAADLRSRFRVVRRVIPVTFEAQAGVLEGDQADDFTQTVHSYVQNFARETALTIVVGLQAELDDAVDNLMNRIKEKGVVKGGTLDMVRRAFEKFQSFEFCMTDELKEKMKSVQEVMKDLDPAALNQDIKGGAGTIAQKLAAGLKELREQSAADEASLRGFGRHKRSLEI